MTEHTPIPSSSLSIALIGAGKIGSAFAYQLARAGHDVTAIARPGSKRLGELRRDAAIVSDKGDRAVVTVAESLDEETPYDLILVTTLAHQVDAVLPVLRRSKARSVLFLFNTYQPERLRDAVGADRAAFGMPMIVASLGPDGALRTMISARRKTLLGDHRWTKLFEASGIPCVFEADMPGWLRCQVPVCIGMEAVSIAGKRRGGGALWREAFTVAKGMQAIFAVTRAMGHPVFPRSRAMMASVPVGFLATMLWLVSRVPPIRNAMANGVGECRSLIDEVLTTSDRSPVKIARELNARIRRMKPTKS